MSKLSSKEIMIGTMIFGVVMVSLYIWGPLIVKKYFPAEYTLVSIPVVEALQPPPKECASSEDYGRLVKAQSGKYFLCDVSPLGWREVKIRKK